MTATEELEAYLSTSRDSRQTWLQRISQNVATQCEKPSAARGSTQRVAEAATEPHRVHSGVVGPPVNSRQGQQGQAQPLISNPSKAALLLKLKVAQQQHRDVATLEHRGPHGESSQLKSARKHTGTRSVQRSVSFELPPSNMPQDSQPSNLRPTKGLYLPSPPARHCRSALKVIGCPWSWSAALKYTRTPACLGPGYMSMIDIHRTMDPALCAIELSNMQPMTTPNIPPSLFRLGSAT